MTFPRDLLIFFPSESLTRGWRKTDLNGIELFKAKLMIVILATQKKRMSLPVSSKELGKREELDFYSFGQLRVLKGRREEENHVSSTSGSLVIFTSSPYFSFDFLIASSSVQATIHDSSFPSTLYAGI
jgi:hypothetical protein